MFRIERYFENIDIRLENTRYLYDEHNALSRAAEANINRPLVHSKKVVASNKDKTIHLIEADDLFLTETFQQVKPSSRPDDRVSTCFTLGKLSKEKTRYLNLRNYPENTDVVVEYVYDNDAPVNRGGPAVTDARSVSVQVQHSLIRMPENDYRPRRDDPRVGYFGTQRDEMTETGLLPWRDVIHRWHLVKKDPTADLSEPVEPITWWVENTTPVEFRPVVKEAIERWNIAFERIGFKNAVVVHIQPDDADWDAGDIRYNVVRWTASPQPPFGGYGPSFVNPRTGQILGADVMIELASISNRLRREQVFEKAGLFDEGDEDALEPHDQHGYCSHGMYMQHACNFGLTMMHTLDMGAVAEKEFVKEILYRLMLHEVGHTLGLSHNFKGSLLNSAADIHNKDVQAKHGLTSTVMEYPAINFAPEQKEQGLFFDHTPGPYDLWVIEYGYAVPPSPDDEEDMLQKILARSTEPALAYANDADDMRSPGKGIDPYAMIYDLSSDPVAYAIERLDLVNATYPKLNDRFVTEGESYHALRSAFLTLSAEYAISLNTISRHIGGVQVNRAFAGQDTSNVPLTPLTLAEQKLAMDALARYAFAPEAFAQPGELLQHLQQQRRGWTTPSTGEDPKLHDRVLNMQKAVIAHLLHPNTLGRIVDSELYGNKYGLATVFSDLTKAIFDADKTTAVNSTRQNLQVEYVQQLANILDAKNASKYNHVARSNALYQLQQIKTMQQRAPVINTPTSAHRAHVVHLVDKALEV